MGDRRAAPAPSAQEAEVACRLVFAIAHEIGNHLGGIRLHAHLIDEEMDARSLADASVSIDSLAGRGGPLLAMVRPLLSPMAEPEIETAPALGGPTEASTWGSVIRRVGQEIEQQGTQGVGFTAESGEAGSVEAPIADWLYPLLVALVESTLAESSRGGVVRLAAETREGEVNVFVEDDGPEEGLSAEAALRGRPLIVALARAFLGRIGGRVEAGRVEAGRTRVALRFGKSPEAA